MHLYFSVYAHKLHNNKLLSLVITINYWNLTSPISLIRKHITKNKFTIIKINQKLVYGRYLCPTGLPYYIVLLKRN